MSTIAIIVDSNRSMITPKHIFQNTRTLGVTARRITSIKEHELQVSNLGLTEVDVMLQNSGIILLFVNE